MVYNRPLFVVCMCVHVCTCLSGRPPCCCWAPPAPLSAAAGWSWRSWAPEPPSPSPCCWLLLCRNKHKYQIFIKTSILQTVTNVHFWKKNCYLLELTWQQTNDFIRQIWDIETEHETTLQTPPELRLFQNTNVFKSSWLSSMRTWRLAFLSNLKC